MIDEPETCIVDLTFSCRVQSKRVEHAFLAWTLKHYRGLRRTQLKAVYNKTAKNTPVGQVFRDLGFREAAKDEDRFVYAFSLDDAIPEDDIIKVVEDIGLDAGVGT